MLANRILGVLNVILLWPSLPLRLISHAVFSVLALVTFGLIVFPVLVVGFIVFYGPLIALSWLWERASILRPIVAMVGIPWALLAWLFATLIPNIGGDPDDAKDRATRLVMCRLWPFSLEFLRYNASKPPQFMADAPASDVQNLNEYYRSHQSPESYRKISKRYDTLYEALSQTALIPITPDGVPVPDAKSWFVYGEVLARGPTLIAPRKRPGGQMLGLDG